MEEKKGFFKNVWTSIKDFEKYGEFAADKVLSAIKYILILTLIFTIVIALIYTSKFYSVLDSAREFISTDIEEMKIENGKLNVTSEEPITIENENSIIPIVIIDTSDNANVEEYVEKINIYETGIVVLSDRVIISNSILTEDESIYYSNLFTENIENKEEFLSLISNENMLYTYLLFFGTMLVYLFTVYFMSNLVDSIVLAALGYILARIVKLRLRFKATFNIGLHALTLPIILNLIYMVVKSYTGFTINYFQWMYTTISYIYVAVAILMIKTEIINQKIQLIKLEKIQEKVVEEEVTKEEEPKEQKKEEDKEEKENGEEPEGSNA